MGNRHDKMAGLVGGHQRRFVEIHQSEIENIQRKFFDYIKSLLESSSNQQNTSAASRPRPDLDVSIKNGFPWMPSVDQEIEQNKQELSKLIRTYLNSHYRKFALLSCPRLTS
jgi:hypothetical protein